MKFLVRAASGSYALRPRGGASAVARGVIYYYLDETMPIYALLAYAKAAKTDMTSKERRAVSTLAAALKATWKERK